MQHSRSRLIRRPAPVAFSGAFAVFAALAAATGARSDASAQAPASLAKAMDPAAAPAAIPAGEPTSAPYRAAPSFDPAIPTLEAFLGHRSGEKVTRPEDAIRYLEALARAAPTRMRIIEYSRSWQGRPLAYAVVASEENLTRIDELKSGMKALGDPRGTDDAAAQELIANLPASVWLSYGVHGNEISSTDAGLAVAYHLLAARGDGAVDAAIRDAVVFIDPVQNPDGRNRFIESYLAAAGLEPTGSRIAAERNEPWPRGRTNHYLFDMNRDWIAQSQPETKGRTRNLLEWSPLVVVDAHEMGTDQTYYFPPEAEPINPYVTDAQMAMADDFAKGAAAAFDEKGFDYFTRDVYDKLFPGYGDSWPAFYGAIAMTFEQGSPRGMKARRTDGTEFTYRDAVHRHAVASMATILTAAGNRERLLREFRAYRVSGLEEGRSGATKAYTFPAGGAAANADALAATLLDQGLELHRARDELTVCGRKWPRGTYFASMAQPQSRMLKTLLDPTSPMKAGFIAEQEARRARGLDDEIYDVTAWSPALALNVAVAACDADPANDPRAGLSPLRAPPGREGGILGPRDAVAYAVEWGGPNAIRFLAAALRDGLKVRSSDGSFTVAGREFPSGSLVLLTADSEAAPEVLRARILRRAQESGVFVHALAATYLEAGDNFGSRHVKRLVAPRIAIAWDEPTDPNSAGATRFVVERRFGYPTTPVRTADLSDKGLDEFDVLVLPNAYGSYADRLGSRGVSFLKEWTARGGVLVAMDGAARFVGDPASGISSARREKAARVEKAPERPVDAATVEGALIADAAAARRAIEPVDAAPVSTSGVFVRATVDADHWLGAGAPAQINALVSGGDVFRPLTLDEGVNVVRFAGPENLLAGGHLWREAGAQIAYKPFLMIEELGDGLVITFTEDPTFRAQLGGLDVLVANAIFRAPAHTGKLR